MSLTPSCVWWISAELLLTAERQLGDPTDSYVNGSQVWLRDDGPGGTLIEWRLHPVSGFRRPAGIGADDLFGTVTFALVQNEPPPVPIETLWDGLEAFPVEERDVEPARLAALALDVLGMPPDRYGLVDHDIIGDDWERTQGRVSIIGALFEQLGIDVPGSA